MGEKLILIQTVIPDYRLKFINQIKKELKTDFKTACGERFFDPTIKKSKGYEPDFLLKNRFFLNNKFLWQSGILNYVFSNSILIISLNPRVLSNWFILIIRKLTGRKTLVWGHAWPKSGMNSKSDKLRHIMRMLADEIIVYTNGQKKELAIKMPNKVIHSAPNALLYKEEMSSEHFKDPCNIIFVSRMVENKKAMLLFLAFEKIVSQLPTDSKLILIGDGPEKKLIKDQITKSDLKGRIILPGTVVDKVQLNEYYKSSLISVSPGRVGLGLTQSLGYGVPMIIAKNELHGPEVEVAVEGVNSYFFQEDNVDDLALKILEAFRNSVTILDSREKLSLDCKNTFSIEVMATTFVNLLNKIN
ncbi:glycosyltransferase [Nonlabens ulvanivorans]|uniref:Glycosyltransferase involved in cell wall biosynthesis n=1 Tax=Nonlabens ulvanivorans TaxID=906888 RepID=A0A084JTY6_NONUL|nr:glycosyltransferase [Nonlabens ulvanivorans]KEZ92420.1 hypothetical protein IL45_09720 [Nonlabens ulvanivorans]PRX15256.1 glycosyltransferase involved in cell wall biosynthesis [Nonlabens ulvanivorans]